jgi:hypothetical protein
MPELICSGFFFHNYHKDIYSMSHFYFCLPWLESGIPVIFICTAKYWRTHFLSWAKHGYFNLCIVYAFNLMFVYSCIDWLLCCIGLDMSYEFLVTWILLWHSLLLWPGVKSQFSVQTFRYSIFKIWGFDFRHTKVCTTLLLCLPCVH